MRRGRRRWVATSTAAVACVCVGDPLGWSQKQEKPTGQWGFVALPTYFSASVALSFLESVMHIRGGKGRQSRRERTVTHDPSCPPKPAVCPCSLLRWDWPGRMK